MSSAKAVIGIMLALAPAGVSLAQGTQPGEREAAILAQIRNHHQGIALWWMGNDGWLKKARANIEISSIFQTSFVFLVK